MGENTPHHLKQLLHKKMERKVGCGVVIAHDKRSCNYIYGYEAPMEHSTYNDKEECQRQCLLCANTLYMSKCMSMFCVIESKVFNQIGLGLRTWDNTFALLANVIYALQLFTKRHHSKQEFGFDL